MTVVLSVLHSVSLLYDHLVKAARALTAVATYFTALALTWYMVSLGIESAHVFSRLVVIAGWVLVVVLSTGIWFTAGIIILYMWQSGASPGACFMLMPIALCAVVVVVATSFCGWYLASMSIWYVPLSMVAAFGVLHWLFCAALSIWRTGYLP